MLDNGNGMMYAPAEEQARIIKRRTHMLNQQYNALTDYQTDARKELLREILGELNENVVIQGPIAFHYGKNTKVGKNTYIGFNFTCQDDTDVIIGENCDCGPNLTIVTPIHPMLPDERQALMCPDGIPRKLNYAKPVHIGNGCWIGANVTILPGVTIGDNCVIGAGSVVVKSVPANSFAAGHPCKVIRTITDADSMQNKPEILGDCQIIK